MIKLPILLFCALFVSCGHLFYQPDRYLYLSPDKIKMQWEEIAFKTDDNVTLYAWYFKAEKVKKPKGTILFFHGNAQNLSSHYLAVVWLVKEGYDLLAIDYRGYGLSEGRPSKDGLYLDALASLKKAFELHQERKSEKFIVYAQSLGGIVSVPAIANYENKNTIDLIVLDSTFSSYQKIAFDKLYSIWWLLPFSPLAYLLVDDDLASDQYFSKLPDCPVLVVHGSADQVIPIKFGRKIFDQLQTEKKYFWEIPNSRHIEGFFAEEKKYRPIFLEKLNEIFQK